MPERRPAASSSSSSLPRQHTATTSVRRNLFHQHLSRRPTTSSTSTSAETLRLDNEIASDDGSSNGDIVLRDKNGEFLVEGEDVGEMDHEEEGEEREGGDVVKERQRLADAVKHHTRDRNRAPSEPAELLEAVRTSLRAKVAAVAEDNWMYEAEDEQIVR